MIVRITMNKDGEVFTMLFGDSYKDWHQQLREYWAMYPADKITKIEASKSPWISWGGLKWCAHEDFQKHLDREGCQSVDLNNPTPRQYCEMAFYEPDQKIIKKVERIHRQQSKISKRKGKGGNG